MVHVFSLKARVNEMAASRAPKARRFWLIQSQDSRGVFAHNFSLRFGVEVRAVQDHVGNTGKGRVPMRIGRRKTPPVGADGRDDFAQARFVGFKRNKALAAEIIAWFHL